MTSDGIRKLAEELVLKEFGHGMFYCGDDEDGCPEIISDKIKDIETTLLQVSQEAEKRGYEKGIQEAAEIAKKMRCDNTPAKDHSEFMWSKSAELIEERILSLLLDGRVE